MEKTLKPSLPSAGNRNYFTAQARRTHVKAYQASGDSMLAYCEKHSMGLSTLRRWVLNYGEKKLGGGFIPATLPHKADRQEDKPRSSVRRLEIITGAIKVVLPEMMDIDFVVKLIKELSHADTTQSGLVMDL